MSPRWDERQSRPVVVVGDVGVDVIVATTGPVRYGTDAPARVRMHPGGAGANTARWLAAAGVPVSLISRVGADDTGERARISLQRDGIRPVLEVDPDRPTCVVVVVVDPTGERTMFPDRGANQGLAPGDLDWAGALAERAGRPHLHLSGYVLLDEQSRPAGLAALRHARAQGWTISVDPAASAMVAALGPELFLSWVDGVDLLVPNADELASLGGIDAVLAAGVQACVVTHGAAGASWCSRDLRVRLPAPVVERPNSTGAGDAFDAGLLSAWLRGAPPEDCVRAGIDAGSRQAGSRPTRWPEA